MEESIQYQKNLIPKFKKRENLYNKIVPSTVKNNIYFQETLTLAYLLDKSMSPHRRKGISRWHGRRPV